MPELPDIEGYLSALRPRILRRPLERIRISSPFLVRTTQPPLEEAEGKIVRALRRLGKRIVLRLDRELFLVFHLMIAGRLGWRKRGAAPNRKIGLAAFDFPNGTLVLTEAGSKKRVSLHIVRGETALAGHDPGGVEPLRVTRSEFERDLKRENHTLKRALTDPRLFAGIGNAYSDEILHAARLSPLKRTDQLNRVEVDRLYEAMQRTLLHWMDRLRADFSERFPGPGDITAFRKGFAVHGRYGLPCPVCGGPVQRIRYAENETNYCPRCQTGGRVLADRSLSRLLKDDWPRSIDELESMS